MGEPTALSDGDDEDGVEHIRQPRSRSPIRIVTVNLANRARRRLQRQAARACLPAEDGLNLVEEDLIDVDSMPNAPLQRRRTAQPLQRRRRTTRDAQVVARLAQISAQGGSIDIESEETEPEPGGMTPMTPPGVSPHPPEEDDYPVGYDEDADWIREWAPDLSSSSSSSSAANATSSLSNGTDRPSLPLPPPPISQSPPLPPASPPPALERELDRSLRTLSSVPHTPHHLMQAVDSTWSLQREPVVPPPPPPFVPAPRWPLRSPGSAQAATNQHHDFPAMALASFRAQQQQAQQAQGDGSWLPSFYVEVVQNGMYGQCSGCGETFVAGQLILGYLLQYDGWQRWVHAPRCIRQVGFSVRPDRHTTVSFNPHTPPWERSQIVEELLLQPVLPMPMSEVRPWLYHGAQARAHIQLIRPAIPIPFEAQSHPSSSTSNANGYDYTQNSSNSLPTTAPPGVRAMFGRLVPPAISGFIPITPPRPPPRPSLESLLEYVPVQRLAKREAEPCVICQEPMLAKESVRRLPCFHVFHLACIDRWLSVKATCPLDNMCLQDMLEKQRSLNGEVAFEEGG